jgi:hypothetical protein
MLALSLPNPFFPVTRWCLVLVCSFLPAAQAAGGGETFFSHHSKVLGQDLVGTAPMQVIDVPGLELIAAEYAADIRQIGTLLRPSPDADVGTGVGSARPSATDERQKQAVHVLIPQPTSPTSPALQALELPQVEKPETKKPAGKNGAKEEELLTSLYLWFAVGSLFMSSVLCCCFPVIDPENMTFNLLVDFAIIGSIVCIALDITNPGNEDNFAIAQYCFTAFFLAEVVVRIRAQGLYFFTEFWGIFDFTLVFASASELWILPIVTHLSKDSPLEQLMEYPWLPNFLRSLRLLRVLRLFRLFRPESTFRHHKDDKEFLDDLSEIWVVIPKDGKSRGKN